MKIGKIVEMLRKPLREALKTAAEMGVSGVQIYAVYGTDHNLMEMSDDEVRDLKKYCDSLGLTVSAVCCDLGGHGFADAAGNPERIAKTKKIIDKAALLDTHVLTTHIGVVPADPSNPRYPVMVEAMRECGEYALAHDMVMAIETGPEPAKTLKRFLSDINCKGCGINLDPANLAMVCKDDPAQAVLTLAGNIVHTHAKDGVNLRDCDPEIVYGAFADGGFAKMVEEGGAFFQEVPLGTGDVDWDAYLSALKEIGYDGYLTIEREVGADPKADIAMAIEFLKARI